MCFSTAKNVLHKSHPPRKFIACDIYPSSTKEKVPSPRLYWERAGLKFSQNHCKFLANRRLNALGYLRYYLLWNMQASKGATIHLALLRVMWVRMIPGKCCFGNPDFKQFDVHMCICVFFFVYFCRAIIIQSQTGKIQRVLRPQYAPQLEHFYRSAAKVPDPDPGPKQLMFLFFFKISLYI